MNTTLKDFQDSIDTLNKELNNSNRHKVKVIKKLEELTNEIYKLTLSMRVEKTTRYLNKKISTLPPEFTKTLFRKKVKIKEITTNKIFEVTVCDYCGADQKGFIVDFSLKDTPRLKGLIKRDNIGFADNCQQQFENRSADLRNIFSAGKNWIYLGNA